MNICADRLAYIEQPDAVMTLAERRALVRAYGEIDEDRKRWIPVVERLPGLVPMPRPPGETYSIPQQRYRSPDVLVLLSNGEQRISFLIPDGGISTWFVAGPYITHWRALPPGLDTPTHN